LLSLAKASPSEVDEDLNSETWNLIDLNRGRPQKTSTLSIEKK
jgi:hypothetical protein